MSIFILSLIITFIIIVIALTCLACGWLFKGKCTLRPGACGRAPPSTRHEHHKHKKSCDICDKDGDQKP